MSNQRPAPNGARPVAPTAGSGTPVQTSFDALFPEVAQAWRPSRPKSSRAASVVSGLLLTVVLLGGFYAVVSYAADLLSETSVEPDGSLVDYAPFVFVGAVMLAWLVAAAVGAGLAVHLRGRWAGLNATLAAVGAFAVMVAVSTLGFWPHR